MLYTRDVEVEHHALLLPEYESLLAEHDAACAADEADYEAAVQMANESAASEYGQGEGEETVTVPSPVKTVRVPPPPLPPPPRYEVRELEVAETVDTVAGPALALPGTLVVTNVETSEVFIAGRADFELLFSPE